ncbi:NXPE family member 3-like [Branchiostoma floridae x Branchiostoma japonicum]
MVKVKEIKNSPLRKRRKDKDVHNNVPYSTYDETVNSKGNARFLSSHINSSIDGRENIAENDDVVSSSPTSSEKTVAHVLNRRLTYRVGEKLMLRIVARDAFSRSKTTGGDFFITKLFSTYPVHASTAGRITDCGNGTYIAQFILGWPGIVTAEVRLIHSSETVNVLRHIRNRKIRRFFSCHFFDAKTNASEWTSCSFNQNERANYSGNICDFSRSDINVTWYCHKPRNVGCKALFECRQDRNKSLRVDDMFTEEENISIKGERVEVPVNISLVVTEADEVSAPRRLPKCGSDIHEPASEGYWFNGTWYSLRCQVGKGFDRKTAIQCLQNKTIYLQGDSTLRQWYSILAKTINSSDNPNTGPKFLGPTVTTNKSSNIHIHFRFHHFPLSGPPARPINVFSFTADEVRKIVGGPDVVIVLGLWAHFCAEPEETFLSRLYGIRHAIKHLLNHFPDTQIFVRTSNTRGHAKFSQMRDNSNWFPHKLLLETKDILGDLNVKILDVWDMSLCQWHEHNVHPHIDVVMNQLDMFYSYLCPQEFNF